MRNFKTLCTSNIRIFQIDWSSVEFCYPPIIISKSSKSGYDLRYTVESSDDNIAHKGVFLVSFGIRYKSYCTNVGRTFIVDPDTVMYFNVHKEISSLSGARIKKKTTNFYLLCKPILLQISKTASVREMHINWRLTSSKTKSRSLRRILSRILGSV